MTRIKVDRWMAVAVALAYAGLAPIPAHAAAVYQVTDLGLRNMEGPFPASGLGVPLNWSVSISAGGQVLANTAGGSYLYSGATKVDLTAIAGKDFVAAGVNDQGQVIGTILGAGGDHAVLIEDGHARDLGAVPTEAIGISDQGMAYGRNWLVETTGLRPGQPPALQPTTGEPNMTSPWAGLLDHSVNIQAGNGAGMLVGATDGMSSAIYDHGRITLVGVPGDDSIAYGINLHGEVVGQSSFSAYALGGKDGALLQGLALQMFQGSLAAGVNNLGQVVGSGLLTESPYLDWYHSAGFLFSGGSLIDLNMALAPGSSDWLIGEALGISDAGQIVALGRDSYGAEHLLLLTPSPVPEPASIAILATGLGLMRAAVRGRRRANRGRRREISGPARGFCA